MPENRHVIDVVMRDLAARVELLLLESAADEATDERFQFRSNLRGAAIELETGVIDGQASGADGKALQSRANDAGIGRDLLVVPGERQLRALARRQRDVMLDSRAEHAEIDEDDRSRPQSRHERRGEMDPLHTAIAVPSHD